MNDSKALMVSLRDRVFEASADALLIGDAEGRILSVNTSFERLFGCDAGTAAGRHFIDFAVDKARLEQCVKPAPNSLERHEIWPSYESAHRRTWLALTVESGDSFLAEVALTFHIEAGTILGFTASIREVSITERLHRDSDKPQISPGLFQRLFEASPGMLAIAGFDGSFCWVNRSWTKVTGFPSEVLASRPLYTLFHEADHARVGCRFANLVGQESETIEFVARCVCADGRYKWISWSASLDADRGFIYIIANDVTELVATRDQLRRSEELLQQTSRVAKVSGWELEMRTLELRWSEEAYRLYGIPMDAQPTVEEAISFFEPDARPMLRAALDRVATEGTPFDLQLPFRRPSGERMWVRVLGQAELVDGEPIRVRGAFQDVSAEWAGERAKRDFVSIVSHELRTPLSSLYGSLRLLEGGVVGALPSPAKRLVGMARSNSDRLLRLIDDLLDLERIETGNLDYNVSDLDMSQVVWRAVGEVQGMAQEASVELEVREQQIPKIHGDPDRLVQVVTNLLSNAIKFSPVGSLVEVWLWLEGGEYLSVAVRDRGPGIPPGYRETLFEKFRQVDSSDTRKRGGTGLGLAIAKAIVEQHEGTVGFDSTEGEGSTFWFSLPMTSLVGEVRTKESLLAPPAFDSGLPNLSRRSSSLSSGRSDMDTESPEPTSRDGLILGEGASRHAHASLSGDAKQAYSVLPLK